MKDKDVDKRKIDKPLLVYVIFVCVLLFWAGVVERSSLDMKMIFVFIGSGLIVCIAFFLLTLLFHFLWNYGLLLASPSDSKYSREVPDIHPATASLVNNAGIFSVKRALSSSLLRLISLGVLSVEKCNSTFVFMRTQEENRHMTEIDKAVLELVDFVRGKRYTAQYRKKWKKSKYHTPLPEPLDAVSLDAFSIASKEKNEEYKSHAVSIRDAVYEDLKKHGLRNEIATLISVYVPMGVAALAIFSPLLSAYFVFGPGYLPDDISGVIRLFSTLFLVASLWFYPYILSRFFVKFFRDHNLLSIKGVLMWKDLRALKRWLEDYTLLEEKDTLSVEVWEKYIVYAAALGVSPRTYGDLAQFVETIDDATEAAIVDLIEDLM